MADTSTNPPNHPVPRPSWQRNLPNALTIARVVVTAAFVAVLSIYRFPDTNAWALPAALVLFIVAATTDALDGYLARKWNVVSVFGRIMDPFADKVLILGAFVMLAGPQFWIEDSGSVINSQWNGQISGVATWMVIVILSRELLVTTIRAVLESRGIDFSANITGKLKMIVQSVAVPIIMLIVIRTASLGSWGFSTNPHSFSYEPGEVPPGCQWVLANHIIAFVVVGVTALSAIPYITRAITALRSPPGSATL